MVAGRRAPWPPGARTQSRWPRLAVLALAATSVSGGALVAFPDVPDLMAAGGAGVSGRTCEPIRVELCRSAVRGYNMTTMPNLAGHESQREAAGHLSTFAPLVQYGCSKQLLIFLCAVLVPMCTDQVDSTAAGAHAEVAGLAEVHPAEAEAGERVVAIGPCRGLCEAVRARCLPVLLNFSYPWPPQLDCARFPPHNSPAHMCMEGPGEDDDAPPTAQAVPTAVPGTRCAEPSPHFSRADKQMAEVWLSVWSGLCFVSSVLALLTLRLGPGPGSPGHGPSPLTSLALSYGLLSVGWGIRVLAGRAGQTALPECEAADLRNPNCAAVFLLTYFFGTASVIWWVVLTVVWFLSAGLRMSPVALQRHSYLFHLAGWGAPAGLTLGILVLRDVAADPLTGVCQVGPTWFTVFVLTPQCAFLCMGLLFLALGALTQWRSKPSAAPWPGPAAWSSAWASTWPLAVERLGLLAGVCAAPLAVLVATHALELGHGLGDHGQGVSLRLFQARLVASLVVGVAAPFWVWPGERPWPPCPPWPRPPRTWRYPAPGKQGATPASLPLAHAARAPAGPAAATAPLLGGSGAVPPPSALLGPPLPAPALSPVVAAPVSAVSTRARAGGNKRRGSASAMSKHHRKQHGSETTV